MNLLYASTCLALAASPVLGQELPEIAGLDFGGPLVWSQTTEQGIAALRWQEAAGEHTLLMVHTTVDPEVAGKLVAEGVQQALPFMVSPIGAGWTVAHPVFAAATDFHFTGSDSVIPPGRVVAFLQQFEESGYSTDFGTHNTGSSPITRFAAHDFVTLPPGAAAADERQAWARTSWGSTTAEGQTFDNFLTSQLGRGSVFQAAYEFAPHVGVPTIDEDGIEILNQLLDSKLGFEIYVQPIAVVPPPGGVGPIEIKFKRHVRIRRYSLFGNENDYWAQVKGAPRHVPSLIDASERVYLAPLGDEMHIVFPQAMSSLQRPTPLRAYVPTVTGYALVTQIANPVLHGQLQRPEVAIFPCPLDATFGTVLIFDESAPTVPILPLGAKGLGANIWVFVQPQ